MPSYFHRLKMMSIAVAMLILPQAAAPQTCDNLLPDRAVTGPNRLVVAGDLVRLRDIGPNWTIDPSMDILSLSPEKSRIAFQLRQADPVQNLYCQGIVVVDLNGTTPARLIDQGGAYIRAVQSLHGVTGYVSGFPTTITPKWSPDGKAVAFLRRENETTQIWLAQVGGAGAIPVTNAPFDIEAFDWSQDGKSLVYSGRPGLVQAQHDIDLEGRSGYLFDDRYYPIASTRPFPRDSITSESFRFDLMSKTASPINQGDHPSATGSDDSVPAGAIVVASNPAGAVAWSSLQRAGDESAPGQLSVRMADRTKTCKSDACTHIAGIWWLPDGKSILYLQENWQVSEAALYIWVLGKSDPVRLLRTEDALLGCQLAWPVLVCAQEGSTQPRRIVSIDLTNGKMSPIFDPNPEWHGLRLGNVTRLHWKNNVGIESFGDLVLPPDHVTGQHHPLIVVQYQTRGFLRGGTDDDYPIQLFAANGYAVLSVQAPVSLGYARGGKTWADISRINNTDWANRRSFVSSIETGVQEAIRQGVVDPDRIGITGLSDGASTLQFALINSRLFKAAASSNCCEEREVLTSLANPGVRKWFSDMGYPLDADNATAFWQPMSFRENAKSMRTPLLLQLPDDEFLSALEGYTALRDQKQPIELYVFPNEHHQKWQPVHRLAIYQRDLDWFDYWLEDKRRLTPDAAEQYKRWDALKANITSNTGTPPGK